MSGRSDYHPASMGPWINARVANVTRSPLAILLIGCAVFVASLVVLVIIPRQARRSQRPVPVSEQRPDTLILASNVRRMRGAIDRIDVEIAAVGDSLIAARAITSDTLPLELRRRRDSLVVSLALLNRLLARVENAPLPASYRALAQAPMLRRNARAVALVDTLAAVEREREDFGASGGVDPIFVALTERAATIGRAITVMAERERTRTREGLAALRELQPRRDTLPSSLFIALASGQRDSARRELAASEETLASARLVYIEADAAADAAVERRRRAANVTVPPVAMLIASGLLGIFAGFSGALAREWRHPRIANVDEAERTAGVRVLAVITESRAVAVSDRVLPPLIAVHADSYRRLYLHLAGARASLAMVTVTGDDPALVGVVSANIAASAGREGRSTLLVDADLTHSPVAAILGAAEAPGLADIAKGAALWPEVLQALTLAHDFSLDIIPSGRRASADVSDSEAERIRRDFARMARRYDVMVLNAPLAHVLRGARSMLPAPDLLLCVRLGQTRISDLAGMVQALRSAGTRVNGLVLWNADDPRIPLARAVTEREPQREVPSSVPAATS